MPDLVAEGPVASIEDGAGELFAGSATFQDWTGHAGSSTAARAFVFEGDRAEDAGRDPGEVFVVLRVADDLHFPIPNSNGFPAATIHVLIRANVPPRYEDDPKNARRDFLNRLGKVFDDLKLLARSPGYLFLRSPYVSGPKVVQRSRPKSAVAGAGSYYEARFMLHAGFAAVAGHRW